MVDALGLLIAGIFLGMAVLYLTAIIYERRVKEGFSKRLSELRRQAEDVKKEVDDSSLDNLVRQSNERASKTAD